jgi:ATP-dependent Clp protease ATP-binding subunit ClpC
MEKFNLVPRAKRGIENAIELANKYKHQKVNSAHILAGIIDCSTIPIKTVLTKFSINIENLKNAVLLELPIVEKNIFYGKKKDSDWLSVDAANCLQKAYELSKELDHEFVGIEHIFYSLFTEEGFLKDFLKSKTVPVDEVAEAIISLLEITEDSSEKNISQTNVDKNEQSEGKFVSKYCENLNESVSKNSSIIEGREKEIEKLIEILSCKVKNNALLLGEAGVGKTAIVEGLAQKINNFDCPVFFNGFKIYSLDLGLMLAGTKYRGQFEERFKGLMQELKDNPQAILFIDEIHSIVGAGSTEGTLDLANMIKPALARGEIKCIGATTHSEFKKFFEKDSALNRRFQVLDVSEPNKAQTFNILKKAKKTYETFHGVSYDDDVLNKIINLSDKYMPYKKFPDKAFDVLDRIGAIGKIEKFIIPNNLKKQEMKIVDYMEKSDLLDNGAREECDILLKSFLKKRNAWLRKKSEIDLKVKDEHLIQIFSKISGLPEHKIEINQQNSFVTLKDYLKSKVVDQDEIIDKIYNILLCAKAGIKKTKKTLANFLFIGPTGVGKTYTAKIIAEKFFEKQNSFLQIDMAEYMEKNSVSKLIGATAGYVGYEEGGLLSEFVRNNPFSLVLFDEVEKAHPDIVNILLKIMDEGFVIDSFNRKIDFTNTIIVLTGNIGAETETVKQMGFSISSSAEQRNDSYLNSVKKEFKPELISRLDEILIFNNSFSKNGLLKLISYSLEEVQNCLNEKNINLIISEEIKDYLYDSVKKQGNNARSVLKEIRSKFELPLSKFIIMNENLKEINTKIVDNDICFM